MAWLADLARTGPALRRLSSLRTRTWMVMSAVGPSVTGMDQQPGELTDVEREILEFERQWWKYAAAKESRVRETFGMSSIHYYQVLNALIDRPEAMAADPMTVRRLIRLREARRA